MLEMELNERQERMLNPLEHGAQTKAQIKAQRKHHNQWTYLPKRRKKSKRKKEVKRLSFTQTPLGDYIKRYCPVEFDLLMRARGEGQFITADIIEGIANSSTNPMLRTTAFRKVLGDFRRYKCTTPNTCKIDVDTECELIRKHLGID